MLQLAATEPDWQAEAGHRWTALRLPAEGKTGFTRLSPAETGVTFTNVLPEWTSAANRVLENGSGAAVGDFDQDGWPDVFLCGLQGNSTLYRNLGHWRFEDVTSRAGLALTNLVARGAVFADLNGDRRLDLLVSTLGRGVVCLLNDGQGRFRDVTEAAGTRTGFGASTLTLADVDGNGTLDLYVANYRAQDVRDDALVEVRMVNGQMVLHPKYRGRLFLTPQGLREFGEPDFLYLNDGQARFRPASWTDGTFQDEEGRPLEGPPQDWGLTAAFHDLNGDGAPDLYVCNDYWTPDRLWINDGRGRFRAAPRVALRHTSENSMGVGFTDLDHDGQVDFLVLDMLSRDPAVRRRQVLAQTPMPAGVGEITNRPQIMRNTLFLNRGDGTFAEIADFAGLPASDWSWQPVFLDVDLDGHEDLLIPAGHTRDVQDLDATLRLQGLQRTWPRDMPPQERQRAFTRQMMEHARLYPTLELPIVAFRNLGNRRFTEVTGAWGTDDLAVHQGTALGDLDRDGDLDLVVNNLNGVCGIYRNDSTAARVAVRLHGLPPNTAGIGARVRLHGGAVPVQQQELLAGGRYLSGAEPLLVFATGQATTGLTLEVIWRTGRTSRVANVAANRLYAIDESAAAESTKSSPPAGLGHDRTEAADAYAAKEPAAPWFEDLSHWLNHTHRENTFDEAVRQPLLPKRLGQGGPGVAWFDLDGDGAEELVIGSGAGGSLAVYRFAGSTTPQRAIGPPWDTIMTRDQTAILGLHRPDGTPWITVGAANYEDGSIAGAAVLAYRPGLVVPEHSVPAFASSVGPLCAADFDGDGDLDLFVGGRVVPGRYPEPATSHLFRQEPAGWVPDAIHQPLFDRLGLVTGAMWSDLEGDGFPELVLACEWGPVRILRNRAGRLQVWDPPVEVWDGRGTTDHRPQTTDHGPRRSDFDPRTSTLDLRPSTFDLRPSTFDLRPSPLSDLTGWWTGVAAGDLDGDGRLDLVVGNWGLNSPYRTAADHPLRLYYGDFRERGTLDLLEAEWDPARATDTPRHRLDYVATGLPWLRAQFPSLTAFSQTTIAELLGDDLPRAAVADARMLASGVFFNRGDRFGFVPFPDEAQWAPGFSVQVADFDGDGAEDVFLSQNFFALPWEMHRLDAGRGLWLRGDGRGGLTAVPGQESGVRVYGEQRGAALADFDADGRVDLVVSQNGNATRLYRNAQAKPGLRVRLEGSPGNPTAAGAVLRWQKGERSGPAREIQAGSGYWSQNGAVQVLARTGVGMRLRVRWPGGRVTETDVPEDAREVVLGTDGVLRVVSPEPSPHEKRR
ncbi:MAG: VCBS repeat-containing protein [Verrucomicrobiales bacterium]|nr:VCBS repeat-containing protein [Verrucomicrobiales bacterium]